MNEFFKLVDVVKEKYAEGCINKTETLVTIFQSVSSLMVNHQIDKDASFDRVKQMEVKLNKISKIVNV